jgi:indolepyruvate ferredoxin oxidoreductase alpha subunit
VERQLLSGNEAIALAALHAGVRMGAGYPGTPSTEILEQFSVLGGHAQWAPNEKVALEVALGAAFGGVPALATMKHVGLNVAADPFFSAAYVGTTGALVIVSADDPGMASSQNEQDNRRYAVMAGVPMIEPSDSQEAYDFTRLAFELSAEWKAAVMLRITTRVCHSKSIVIARPAVVLPEPKFERDIENRVMIPAHARPAHRRLRARLAKILAWNEQSDINVEIAGSAELGIITSGISFVHAREAAPEATFLKLGMTHPVPVERARAFAAKVKRCIVIEEGDPYLVEQLRMAGVNVEDKPEMYRFNEFNVGRVRRILAGDVSPESPPPRGKPPQLCAACPHRGVFAVLRKKNCIVAGDIGCYTLGVLPPFRTMDLQACMGASITMGLGLRHILPDEESRRIISVIGDSTFMHSGLTGIAEMVYNPPKTGHIVVILDNGTTAMTGMQEHPGTGRTLAHLPTGRVVFENVIAAMGIPHVHVVTTPVQFENLLDKCLLENELTVIIVRHTCRLAAPRIEAYIKAAEQQSHV